MEDYRDRREVRPKEGGRGLKNESGVENGGKEAGKRRKREES